MRIKLNSTQVKVLVEVGVELGNTKLCAVVSWDSCPPVRASFVAS